MDVCDVFAKLCELEIQLAELDVVEAAVADVGRVRARLDVIDIELSRRLKDLSKANPMMSPENEMAKRSRSSRRKAERTSARATVCNALPELEQSLGEGKVSGEHVDAVARAAAQLEPADRDSFLKTNGAQLVKMAEQLTPEELARAAKEKAARHSSDEGLSRLEKQKRATRCKTWTDAVTGMLCFSGQMDPESGMAFVAKLNATMNALFAEKVPDTCPTDVFLKQDHLRGLALIHLVNGTGPKTSGRPDFVVVIDEQTLRDGLHDQSIVDLGGPDADLPVETLRRLACEANLIPAVLNSDGVVTDLGRSTRLASREQRQALQVMYATCAFCSTPFSYCEIHHIDPWQLGGTTDLSKLIPVCIRDHHRIHEGGWTLSLDPKTRVLTVSHPDGTTRTIPPPRARAA